MYMAISMEQQQMIRSASISQRPIFTGVVLIDAIGKRYEIPIELAGSYEVCLPETSICLRSYLTMNRYSQMRSDFSSRTIPWKLGFSGNICKMGCMT